MPARSTTPLEQLDPAQVWQPWEPSDKQPWNLKWAGHLFRRAGFGANLTELREAVKKGHRATLDQLLDVAADRDRESTQRLGEAGRQIAGLRNTFKLRAWWLDAMLCSPNPLREKMTLFWHNHFATSIVKVRGVGLLFQQNQLLRRHALEKFGPLLQEMSKDPAMLLWLDNNSNVKERPNENYAREVMELFSLGVGNYTEKDVREAARAFTGWQVDPSPLQTDILEAGMLSVRGFLGPQADRDLCRFEEALHDGGEKTLLGETGKWQGEDVVRLCLKQDACARFLVRKLYRYFLSEGHEPPDALLEPLCKQLRDNDYDIGAVVKTLLRSRFFFSDQAHRQRIKSPVEFAVGTMLALTSRPVAVEAGALVPELEEMGQVLFAPPNVKGWPGGKAWLTTITVLARHNFARRVADGALLQNPSEGLYNDFGRRHEDFLIQAEAEAAEARRAAEASRSGASSAAVPSAQAQLDVAALLRSEKVEEPAAVASLLTDLLLQGDAAAGALARLTAFLEEGKPRGEEFHRRVRAAMHAVMTRPEYQLA